MSLDPNWFQAAQGTPAESLGQWEYLIYKDTDTSMSTNSSSATITYLVAWNILSDSNNLKNFLSDVLGYGYLDSFVNPLVKRIVPHAHFDYQFFYAVDAAVEGVGTAIRADNGSIEYDVAKVTVTYRPLDYAIKTDAQTVIEMDRYVTRKYSVTGQYLTLNGVMRFVSPANTAGEGQVLPTQPGKIVGMMDLEYTWHAVPALIDKPFLPPNILAVTRCLGKINSTVFDPGNLNAPPGTILFESMDPKMIVPTLGGPEAEGRTINGGLYSWDISMKFKYLNNGLYVGPVGALTTEYAGHNYIYRTVPNNPLTLTLPMWDLVTSTGATSGARIYVSTDLNTLFTVPTT